jgi:hypothetical protein
VDIKDAIMPVLEPEEEEEEEEDAELILPMFSFAFMFADALFSSGTNDNAEKMDEDFDLDFVGLDLPIFSNAFNEYAILSSSFLLFPCSSPPCEKKEEKKDLALFLLSAGSKVAGKSSAKVFTNLLSVDF